MEDIVRHFTPAFKRICALQEVDKLTFERFRIIFQAAKDYLPLFKTYEKWDEVDKRLNEIEEMLQQLHAQWKTTIEYRRTKDILHVMQVLGHRNIKNTLVYTQLIDGDAEDVYVCKAVRTVEQAAELIEAGFEYVCEMEGFKLFCKRR